MSESDMFSPDGNPACGVCNKKFYPDTSFSLHFCSEECIQTAVTNNHRYAGRADRYFVRLRAAEIRILQLEAMIAGQIAE